MTTTKEKTDEKKPLTLSGSKTLELKKTVESGQVRQSFSHGRSKTVQVEVKRKRLIQPGEGGRDGRRDSGDAGGLTKAERDNRLRVVEQAREDAARRAAEEARQREEDERRRREEAEARLRAEAEAKALAEEEARRAAAEAATEQAAEAETPLAALPAAAEPEQPAAVGRQDQSGTEAGRPARVAPADRAQDRGAPQRPMGERLTTRPGAARGAPGSRDEGPARQQRPIGPVVVSRPGASRPVVKAAPEAAPEAEVRRPVVRPAGERLEDEDEGQRAKKKVVAKPVPARAKNEPRRRQGKLTISQALGDESEEDRQRSLAAVKRQREREKQRAREKLQQGSRVVREVVIPEAITVQELANRMAERGGEVVKTLMRLGIMATINQTLDGDTAELVVSEFGHRARRVSAEDVEIGLAGEVDEDTNLEARPPVVTVMGHVDHGKTSLLDALRHADVAAHEAGGITQHIGAYQIEVASGNRITFIDTPGHAAFTEMRARGANVTDIVVLVVAADDGIMAQTIEALNHAKAAEVPIIVAVNKIDKPEADVGRVKNELLRYELVPEDMGGDVIVVPVSAKTGQGLDDLVESIVVQAEILDLRANPNRNAQGVIIESKLEQGRGAVATVLIQNGTLRVGDSFVAGSEYGRVRALISDKGERVEEAGSTVPVEVLGLNGAPEAGEDFQVVDSETRAREVSAFRTEKKRSKQLAAAAGGRGSLEQMMSAIRQGEAKTVPVVIKSDVHGSLEAIVSSLEKLGTDEVKVQVLHSGVGGINESDITLARASNALVIAFNVRASAPAREQAKRDGVEIRYYSIIYNVIDEVKALMSGMLSPEQNEKFLGYAEIRAVFEITKVGKVAGCMVTEGNVKRGAKVRLLRDDVVIHDGTLKTLRRFKDEVREVQQGYECGMSFENYSDIRVGDRIECYEIEEVARTL